MAWKAWSHSTSYSPNEAPFKALKKGLRRYEYLEMNIFSVASFPIKTCICFLILGVAFVERLDPAWMSFRFHAYSQESQGTSQT